jgi:SAM-dependent methyltransferase
MIAENGRALSETLEQLRDVEGWLSEAQARRLWHAAARVSSPGRIVEVGSFRGRSTIVLASASADGVEVIAIDPHAGSDRGPQEVAADAERGGRDFAAFHANLRRAGIEDRVRHMRVVSLDALGAIGGGVDLLYVDGVHRYRLARDDLKQWGSRVEPGGTMLVHDSFNAVGVTLALLRLMVLSRQWRYLGRCGSLAEYRRELLTFPEATTNVLRQIYELSYFARNLLVKIALVGRLTPLARFLGHHDSAWPY